MASLIRNADIAPDAAIASTKLAVWAAHRSAGGFKLTSLAAGVDPGDAVNKAQLDAQSGGGTWGSITGTLSDQTDLQSALNAKVSAVSIASANGVSGSSSGGQTPILTIALGAITPSSVVSTGIVTGTNLSGTNTGDQTITLTGNVTGSGTGSFAATIANSAVTLAKMADVATASVFYRKTAGTGAPEVNTLATLKTDLGLTGTNSGDQTITLSGDVSGTGTGAITTVIGAGKVTLSMLADLPGLTVIGRTASTPGPPQAIAGANGTILRVVGTTLGFGSISASSVNMATDRLLGRSTAGAGAVEEIMIGSGLTLAAGTLTSSGSGGTVTAVSIVTANGVSGSSSGGATPALTIALGAITPSSVASTGTVTGTNLSGTNTGDQTITLTGDVTGTGTGSFAATIANDAVTLAKMANMATASFLGRNTAGTGDPEILSIATVSSMLNLSGLYQPLDQDLTSLSAASGGHDIYYRTAQGGGTWIPVIIGANLSFVGNTLSQLFQEAGRFTPTDEIVSAGTLVLTGLDAPYIDVTGATNITAITLADGQQMELRFTGAGLTITPDASLLTPGGLPLVVATGGLVVASALGGVVTITDYQNAAGYSVQTFDNLYMNDLANIGYSDDGGSGFNIGKNIFTASGGGYIHVAKSTDIELLSQVNPAFGAGLNLDSITGNRLFTFPNQSGVFSLVAGVESLTNKKLGSLTTNGFVKTSAGDGTLSVDTVAYQPLDADLTTWAGITPGANVGAFLATPSSANLAAAVTGETGTGALVFGSTPTLETPVINGIPTGTGVSTGDPTSTPGTLVLRDVDGNIFCQGIGIYGLATAANLIQGYDTAASSGTPITLVFESNGQQYITGTTTNQTFNLPLASGLPNGWFVYFRNKMTSTGTIILLTSGGNTLLTLAPGTAARVTCSNSSGGTGTASWTTDYPAIAITTAKKLTVTHSLTLAGTDGTTHTFPSTSSSVARIDAAQTFTGDQTFSSSVISKALTGAGTSPTCTGATIGTGSRNNAGFVTATTTGVSTIVVTFSTTAPLGWAIAPQNNTTANLIRQTASSATTATFVGTTVTGDVISFVAMAY